ncbi:guanylate kinase [candidate division KSB1 bacterium]|nr:guanylate kinase [candidate division KSB1 bacterium]
MSGLLVVVSAPSGAGKSSIIAGILKNNRLKYHYSVSATTRVPRKGEVDGIDYCFLSEAEFRQKIDANEFIEWAEVHGYYYGTLREKVERRLSEQYIVVLDLDVIGARAVKTQYPESSLLIFIVPPSKEVLLKRLRDRATDCEAEIRKRMGRYDREMSQAKFYDYTVINEDLERTILEVENLIIAACCRK